MNTTLSEQKVKNWKAERPKYQRKVINHIQTFQAIPDEVFICYAQQWNMDGWLALSNDLFKTFESKIQRDFQN